MKLFSRVLPLALAASVLAGGSALALEKVHLAHAGATLLRLPLYVALQQKLFQAEGLDVEVVETRSGSDASKMLVGGSVQFTTGQLIDAILVDKQKIDIKGVAMLTSRLTNSIIIKKSLAGQVKSMKDLKGRQVGVTGIGSGTWQFAVYAAKMDGLSAEDLNFIGVGTAANIIGAVKSGRVEAMSYADPENYKLVQDGDAVFLIDMTDDATHRRLAGESYLNNQIMVLGSYAKEKPQNVQAFVNAIQRAIVWVNASTPEQVAELLHKMPYFEKNDKDQFLTIIKRALPHGVSTSAAISKAAFDSAMKFPLTIGAVDAAVPMAKIVDNSFAEKATQKYPAKAR